MLNNAKAKRKLMKCYKKYIAKQEYGYLAENLENPRTYIRYLILDTYENT